MGVFITRLRSYQLSLVDRQGLRINLIYSGQNVRGGFLYEVTHSTALPVAVAVSSSASPLIRLIVRHHGR